MESSQASLGFSRDSIVMTKEGLLSNFNISKGKFLYWTDDKDVELPIIIRKGDTIPIRTIPEVVKGIHKKMPDKLAMVGKKAIVSMDSKGQPKKVRYQNVRYTWKRYYADIKAFARSLIKIGV